MDKVSETNTLQDWEIPLGEREFISKFPRVLECGVQKLYKFMRFDLKFVSDILVRRKLYLPRPSEFNDPWGLSPWVNIDLPNVDECNLRKNILSVFQRLRIGCFTSDCSNALLWSHYAEQHQGLCLGFNAKLAPFSYAHKVHYSRRYPTIDLKNTDSNTIVNLCSPVLTKSSAWSYEKEFRLVSEKNLDRGFFALPDDSVQVVYIGARAPEDYRRCVEHLAKVGPFSPRIFQAEIREDEFALNFQELALQ